MVVTVLLLAGLTYFKAYKTVFQRLFLYLVFSTMVHELIRVAGVEHSFHYQHQDQVCVHLGFLSNWTTWILCDFNICIIVFLLLIVYSQVKGHPCPKLSRSRRVRSLLEVVCVLVAIMSPLCIVLVPYRTHQYGLDESFCWLKSSCNSTQFVNKLIYGGYAYFLATGTAALCTGVGVIFVYCSLAPRYANAKYLLRQISIFLFANIGILALLGAIFVVAYLKSTSQSEKIFFAASTTVIDLVFLVGYLLTFYFPRFCSGRRSKQSSCARQKDATTTYKTFKESEGVSCYSDTRFDVEYTGEFTDVQSITIQ